MDEHVRSAGQGSRWEREAVARLPDLLGEWLEEPVLDCTPNGSAAGLAVRTASHALIAEVRGSDDIAALGRAVEQLRRLPTAHGEVPLLVVPYMGPSARAWARAKGVSWADLSGNADIRARNLRVHVEGNANRYAHSGRPANPFAPKYARVSRVLLADTDRWWRQRDLCGETALSDATVSRAVGHLARAELLETAPDGAVRARDPSALLDAWAQRYSFADHRVHRFQVVARTGPAALQSLARNLCATRTLWAATGLSAAYMWTQFADFRLNTIFVDQLPSDTAALGLHPVERGGNVWLVVPCDDGVFYRMSAQGVSCVHPVQAWLDLPALPERAAEAASHLRAELLQWRA